MKTTIKRLTVATIFALILFTGNVKADGTETIASSLEINEITLALENWMTDDSIGNESSTYTMDFAPEMEAELEIEDWMMNEYTWDLQMSLEIELEASLELEDWMVSDKNWNVEEKQVEKKLALENWMTDNKIWE